MIHALRKAFGSDHRITPTSKRFLNEAYRFAAEES